MPIGQPRKLRNIRGVLYSLATALLPEEHKSFHATLLQCQCEFVMCFGADKIVNFVLFFLKKSYVPRFTEEHKGLMFLKEPREA
jgi:hypothetical protein